jgi:hypothetical protein
VKKFNFKSILQVLQSGAIYIIGDPRFKFKTKDGITYNFSEWTGLSFYWDNLPGDTVIYDRYTEQSFENYDLYINHLDNWDYSLKDVKINESIVTRILNLEQLKKKSHKLRIDKHFFCKNRYDYGLAFELNFNLVKFGNYSSGYREDSIQKYGPFIFLPKISLNDEETIEFVLKNLFNLEISSNKPVWIDSISVPSQNIFEQQISEIEEQITDLTEKLNEKKEQLESERNCLKLLYGINQDLEIVVREILRKLGAKIEEPEDSAKEDGWITVNSFNEIYEGVLEIKSTKADCFDEKGRKQILDWVNRGISLRQKKYKGIFIGNSSITKILNKRKFAFSDSWVKSAKIGEICAIKTEHLLVVYFLQLLNMINIDLFWKELFKTNGIFDASKYIKLLPNDLKIHFTEEFT